MQSQNNIANPKYEIKVYMKANGLDNAQLRRRAVIFKERGIWKLYACVVEVFLPNRTGLIQKVGSRKYSNAMLIEEWLHVDELLAFVEIAEGKSANIGDCGIFDARESKRWSKEMLPIENSYMPFAGCLWSTRFQGDVYPDYEPLLMPKAPYYPNLQEAVRDWLDIPIFREGTDARKGEILLLLPENRAYFSHANHQEGKIELIIEGAEVGNLELEVKGAWWDGSGIHHVNEHVTKGRVVLSIPDDAKRLEYVLADEKSGVMYDYQEENGERHTGLGRKNKTGIEKSLESKVREALKNGEGPKIEFKPFIYPDKDKMYEIIKTVAAFANTVGGQIFLGISDGCELIGIDEELPKWAKESPDEKSGERYLGEVKGKVRDQLTADVAMEFNQLVIDGMRVAVIEVMEAKRKPVTTRKENFILYLRRGASNVKASPEEWSSINNSERNGLLRHLVG